MAWDPRTRRIATVVAAGYAGRAIALVVLLVSVPMMRGYLDSERFGVWMMLSALMAFFAYADLGIGNSLMNLLTRLQAKGRLAGAWRVMVAGYACTAVIGVALSLVWLLWLAMAERPELAIGSVSPVHRVEIIASVTVFILLSAANLPATLAYKAQLAFQQGHWMGWTQAAQGIAGLLGLWLVVSRQGSLVECVLGMFGVQVAVAALVSQHWIRRHWLQRAAIRTRRVDGRIVAILLRSGALFFGLQLSAALAFHSDAIVISRVIGPEAYGEYAVVQRVFMVTSTLLGVVMVALWPTIGDALARDDRQWVHAALRRSLVTTGCVSLILVAGIALTIQPILRLWLNMDTPVSSWLVMVLAAWTVVEAVGAANAAFLNAANLIAVQLAAALTMASTALLGKVYLTGWLGPVGAPLATLCAYLCVSVPVQVYLYRKHFLVRSH